MQTHKEREALLETILSIAMTLRDKTEVIWALRRLDELKQARREEAAKRQADKPPVPDCFGFWENGLHSETGGIFNPQGKTRAECQEAAQQPPNLDNFRF